MAFTNYNNQQLTLSGVWNNSAVDYTRFKIDVLGLNSLNTSKLFDVRYNNSSLFSIGRSGVTVIPTTGSTIYMGGAYKGLAVGNCAINYGTDGVIAGPGGFIFINGSIDNREFTLIRDSANTLAQRNNSNAQTFRLYNSYTNASNYERAGFNWNASAFEIETEASGAGLARNLVLGTSGTPRMIFSGTGARIDSSGMFVAGTIYPGNQTNYFIRNNSNRIEFATIYGRFFSADSNAAIVIPDTGKYGFGPGDPNAFIYRVRSGVIGVTSALEALSSVTAPIVSATTYLNLYPSVSSLLDGNYVNVSGDTMTGALTVSAPTTTALTVVGTQTQNNGFFSAAGDADKISYVMRAITKNGSSAEMFLDGASTRQVIPANTSWNATVRIVAKTDKFENRYATFDRKLLISKGDTNATTQIIGPVQVLGIDTGSTAGSPPAGWAVSLTADTTNGSLKINVTGELGTFVRWVANVDLVEVGYEGSLSERTESLFTNGEEGVWFDASGFDPAWRRNLFNYSEDLTNSTWQKQSGTTIGSSIGELTISPRGDLTAQKIKPVSNGTTTGIRRTLIWGQGNVISFYVKAGEITELQGQGGQGDVFTINLLTGATFFDVRYKNGSIENVGNGWWRVSYKTTYVQSSFWLGSTTGANGSNGFYLWGLQEEFAVSAPTSYQKTTSDLADFELLGPSRKTIYSDSEAITPVTGVGQTVGLLLDKSKNFEKGPELAISDFTQWTSSTNFIRSTTGVSAINATQYEAIQLTSVPYVPNAWYEVIYDVTVVNGLASVSLGNSGQSPGVTDYTGSSFRVTRIFFYPSTNGTRLTIRAEAANSTFYVNYLSVRQLKGNHAYQLTGNNRPTLSARYNQLLHSQNFLNSPWSIYRGALTRVLDVSAPDKSFTVHKHEINDGTGEHFLRQSPVTLPDSSMTLNHSCYAKAGNNSWFSLRLAGGYHSGDTQAWFNLTSGTIGTTINCNASISAVGEGWYRCSMSCSSDTTSITPLVDIYSPSADNTRIGASGNYNYIWGAQLSYGSSLLNYQMVGNTANYYDSRGFIPYLDFDGSNDSLSVRYLSLSGITSSLSYYTGLRKLNDTAANIIFEHSTNAGSNNGTFYLVGPTASGASNYYFLSKGTTSDSTASIGGYLPWSINVVAGSSIINSDTNVLRVDGIQRASNTADQGTGSYGTYPLYIGARGGSQFYFRGHLYSLVIRGASTNSTVFPLVENYVAQQTGVTLP